MKKTYWMENDEVQFEAMKKRIAEKKIHVAETAAMMCETDDEFGCYASNPEEFVAYWLGILREEVKMLKSMEAELAAFGACELILN